MSHKNELSSTGEHALSLVMTGTELSVKKKKKCKKVKVPDCGCVKVIKCTGVKCDPVHSGPCEPSLDIIIKVAEF